MVHFIFIQFLLLCCMCQHACPQNKIECPNCSNMPWLMLLSTSLFDCAGIGHEDDSTMCHSACHCKFMKTIHVKIHQTTESCRFFTIQIQLTSSNWFTTNLTWFWVVPAQMDGFKTQLKNCMSTNGASLSMLKKMVFWRANHAFPIKHDQAN